MDRIAAQLQADATPSGPPLLLRPWSLADATDLVDLFRDDALRRWISAVMNDEASAARWIGEQQRGWEAGDRFGFAVVEIPTARGNGGLVGHVVLKNVMPGVPAAEVGYWTAAHARGRAVAPRALEALTDWAFTALPHARLTRLELVHQVDNTASCRVAQKTRYTLTTVLPPTPPAYPHTGHLHTRTQHP